jgi:hypothetical protein
MPQFYTFMRGQERWKGVDDLSATMRFLWDDQYLYLGVAVTDEIFHNSKQDGSLWNGDGLQILIDPCRASEVKVGKYDYGFAKGTAGDQASCFFTADPVKAPAGNADDITVKVTPTGENGNMIYEVAIPWNRVSPFQPTVGGNLGLAFILNEDDADPGREGFLAWFGCAHSKIMSMNGDLILLDAP